MDAFGCMVQGSFLTYMYSVGRHSRRSSSSSSRNRTGKPYAAHLARLDYLLIYWPTQVRLTLTKIIKIVATRWRILRLKCTKFDASLRDASSCKIWCGYLYPFRSYWHFSEIQDGGRRHVRFSDYVNLAIRVCWQCGICVLYQIGLKYMQWLLRSTHLCFRYLFDDVTRINFRFRLLVTWSSAHGRDASSCKISCRYLSNAELLTFCRN